MQYTEFSLTPQGDLQIHLTSAGKTKLENLLNMHAGWSDDEVFLELIDEQHINGWVIVPPDQIRAMRDQLILSDTAHFDDDGNLSHIESAYWHPNNMLGVVSKLLLQHGYVVFEKGQ